MALTEQQVERLHQQDREARAGMRAYGEIIKALAQQVKTLEGLFNALYDRVVAPDGTDRVTALEEEMAKLKVQVAWCVKWGGFQDSDFNTAFSKQPAAERLTRTPPPPGETGPNEMPRYEVPKTTG